MIALAENLKCGAAAAAATDVMSCHIQCDAFMMTSAM
jgi:hypothetical protein